MFSIYRVPNVFALTSPAFLNSQSFTCLLSLTQSPITMQKLALIFFVTVAALMGVQAAPIEDNALLAREINAGHVVRDVALDERKNRT